MENGWKSPFPCIKMIGHGVPGTSHFGFCRIFQGPSFPEEDGTIQPSAVRCKMSVSKRMHTNHGEHIQKTHETYGNNIGNTWKQYRKNTKKHKKLTVAQHHHPPQLFFLNFELSTKKPCSLFRSSQLHGGHQLTWGEEFPSREFTKVFLFHATDLYHHLPVLYYKMGCTTDHLVNWKGDRFIHFIFPHPISSVSGLMDILFNRWVSFS